MTPPPDPALPLSLMPAMIEGGRLKMEGAISPRVHRMQPEFQAIQVAWSQDWTYDNTPLHEVEVEAATREVPTPKRGRVAAYFSGGVDSWATVLSAPDVTDLIFVRGLDIVPDIAPQHVGLAERVEATLREMAADLGMPLHVLETNVRELSENLLDWHVVHGCALAGIGLYCESLFERVLIPTDTAHGDPGLAGPSYMVDGLWSTEAIEIVDHGSRIGRFERTRLLAGDPRARASLRVCFENPGGAYNCGRCRKCLLTMVSLEALGVRSECPTFPSELDLFLLDQITPVMPVQQTLWMDCLRGVRECDREDLAPSIEGILARGASVFTDPALLTARQEAEAAQAQLREVLGSSSWRLTAPLRRLGARVRALPVRRGPNT